MLIFLRRGQTKNLPPPFPGLENPKVEAACARRSSPCQLGSLPTAKVSHPIIFLSKQSFHCIIAAMRTSPTSSIQKQGHWCVSCINSVKNRKSSIVVIMLSSPGERSRFLQHLRQGPKSSRRSQGWPRHFRLRPDNIYTALGIPGSYLLISTFSVKPFVQQLHLFSHNLPEEDVPCRLFIFTPTAWIQAENHKIF